jgi:hypothetical protein
VIVIIYPRITRMTRIAPAHRGCWQLAECERRRAARQRRAMRESDRVNANPFGPWFVFTWSDSRSSRPLRGRRPTFPYLNPRHPRNPRMISS